MAQAKGGSRIRNVRARDYPGTLGCVVRSRDDPNARYILSAAHVIALNGVAQPGDAIEYEDPADGTWHKIAEFERFVHYRDTEGALQLCDAAIARITRPELMSSEIEGIGKPRDVAGPYKDMRVQFCGATSGFKNSAVVHSTGVALEVIYNHIGHVTEYSLEFQDQILYGTRSGGSWEACTQGADSGALVLDHDNLAVGLHIAITPGTSPIAASVCTPIRTVLAALNVELELDPAAPAPPPDAFDPDAVGERSFDDFGISIRSLLEPHNVFGGSLWNLSPDGLIVEGELMRSPGRLVTLPRVWGNYAREICAEATRYHVPVELIVATICTESGGNPNAVRTEPKFVSEASTPDQISVGLMQTLVSTAREAVSNPAITAHALLSPQLSIQAGTAYIDRQRVKTRLDPPQVACAYNAGGVYKNEGAANRWKMRQYPIGSGEHAKRFTWFFNDTFAFFRSDPSQLPPANVPSFYRILNGL